MVTTAEAISELARAVRALGNGDAGTTMGGLEALGAIHKEGLAAIADAISGGFCEVADAIESLGAEANEQRIQAEGGGDVDRG